jgi:hypothetical protein
MDIDDFEEWNGKYNIGDMFVDTFGSDDVVSYIYRIEYEPNSKITYYWLRYFYNERDKYVTEEELDNAARISCFKHYPVKK